MVAPFSHVTYLVRHKSFFVQLEPCGGVTHTMHTWGERDSLVTYLINDQLMISNIYENSLNVNVLSCKIFKYLLYGSFTNTHAHLELRPCVICSFYCW